MENKKEGQKWRIIGIGAGIAASAVLVLLIVLGIVWVREKAAYKAEMERLEALYKSYQTAAQDDSKEDKRESEGEKTKVDMTDEYSYGGNAAANLFESYNGGKLAKMMGDETVYYYADNSGNLYRKSLSDSEWELIIHKEGSGKNILDLNVDNIGGQYVYYKYQDKEEAYLNNGIYRLNVETLEEEQLISDEGRGEPDEPRLMNGKLYYLRDSQADIICCMDLETLQEEILFKPTEEFYSISSFSVMGNEIIFRTLHSVMKLTLDGELSTLYEGLNPGMVIPCEGRLFFTDDEDKFVYEMDYDGNLTGTYEIKEPYMGLTYVKNGYLYGYKNVIGDEMLIKVHMETGNQEIVLDCPDDMYLEFVNIVDETILLGLFTLMDDGYLIDLYALPADATDMTLEDCVHLQQTFERFAF